MYNVYISWLCACNFSQYYIGFIFTEAGEQPSLTELLSFPGRVRTINIPEEIGDNYTSFGVFLLKDHTGAKVNALAHQHSYNAKEINLAILREWLQGKGRKPVIWQTLVDTLRDSNMNTLADAIKQVKQTSI